MLFQMRRDDSHFFHWIGQTSEESSPLVSGIISDGRLISNRNIPAVADGAWGTCRHK
jgi:hypothetical protein